MKKTTLPFLLIFFIGVLSFNMFSSNIDNISEEVIDAIRRGNSRELARYLGNNVDLVLPGNEGTYSKAQAEVILRNFFLDNRPDSFTINHQTVSRDGSPYVIGIYETTSNKSFRTYFLIKKVADDYFIHHIHFELQ